MSFKFAVKFFLKNYFLHECRPCFLLYSFIDCAALSESIVCYCAFFCCVASLAVRRTRLKLLRRKLKNAWRISGSRKKRNAGNIYCPLLKKRSIPSCWPKHSSHYRIPLVASGPSDRHNHHLCHRLIRWR